MEIKQETVNAGVCGEIAILNKTPTRLYYGHQDQPNETVYILLICIAVRISQILLKSVYFFTVSSFLSLFATESKGEILFMLVSRCTYVLCNVLTDNCL